MNTSKSRPTTHTKRDVRGDRMGKKGMVRKPKKQQMPPKGMPKKGCA